MKAHTLIAEPRLPTATAAAQPALDHVIAAFAGDKNGPTLVVIGSLHGNEAAGALALERVAADLELLEDDLNGRVFLIRGNTRALQRGLRFIDSDLNRHWTDRHLSERGSGLIFPISEGLELRELDTILDHVLVTARDEVYVVDLHSTSAAGMPFATVGDTLRNRRFAQKFPVPILLGIEEQLDGTLLEYLNNAGAVTFGFEGGPHTSETTIANHEAITWLALVNAGILKADAVPRLAKLRQMLASEHGKTILFEVLERHAVTSEDQFEMDPGFNNFDAVSKRSSPWQGPQRPRLFRTHRIALDAAIPAIGRGRLLYRTARSTILVMALWCRQIARYSKDGAPSPGRVAGPARTGNTKDRYANSTLFPAADLSPTGL